MMGPLPISDSHETAPRDGRGRHPKQNGFTVNGKDDHRNGDDRNGDDDHNFHLRLSKRFLLGTLLVSCLTAFAVGRLARYHLIDNARREFLDRYRHELKVWGTQGRSPDGTATVVDSPSTATMATMALPNPIMRDGRDVPQTTYTSKNFNTGLAGKTHSRWVVTERGQGQCDGRPGDKCAAVKGGSDETPSNFVQHEEEEAEPHLPAGQHLLIDIDNVDSAFLNSEEQLANAMLELVNTCGLTLLSYHCHKLSPDGVSCAGVLLESHVSFHTWPQEGVITLDLFTCGPRSLLPIVPLAERLFAVPSSRQDEPLDSGPYGNGTNTPNLVWAYKYRGFDEDLDSAEMTDMFHFPLGQMSDFKEEIMSVTTDFQRMDVYDVLRPGRQSLDLYQKSLATHVDSYESRHPELFEPDRIIFLDGVLQSRRSGEAPYHEALVHPALFTHGNPRRVAIIGGGEGATLREVLKHNTVEKVIMIDIDEQMVGLSRQHLPSWSDCSTLVGSSKSCFDDPRVETYFLDAFKWFIDRFSADGGTVLSEEPFDVIIMDALDPQVQKEFVDALYDGGPFVRALPNALTKNGILVAQVGEATKITYPSEEFSINRNRMKFIQTLVALGFASINDYQESHGGFERPWQFVVAFMDYDARAEWYANSALVDVKIRQRGMRTTNGASPFLYFDGMTMQSYQYPSKPNEVVFCRGHPDAKDCKNGHGFDPDRINKPLTSLEVKPSTLGEKAGRGVFAKVDIPQNSYLGLERLIPAIYMSPHTAELTTGWDRMEEIYLHYQGEKLEIYTHGYGHYFSRHGKFEVVVDSTFQCFINHGCRGSSNVGHNLTITEESADPEVLPNELSVRQWGGNNVYNPAKERQIHFYSSAIPLRDIQAGEELFDNYLGMTGLRRDAWAEDVVGLKHQCNGGAGYVTLYDALSSGDESVPLEFSHLEYSV